jgi:hypothetical protein
MIEDQRNKKGQTYGASALNAKQERAILAVLESRSVEEACKKARISKTLYYRWLREDPGFGTALRTRRDAASNQAFDGLRSGLSAAVDVLVALLASENEWVRRVGANDVICRVLKAKELMELEDRLERLETAMLHGRNG